MRDSGELLDRSNALKAEQAALNELRGITSSMFDGLKTMEEEILSTKDLIEKRNRCERLMNAVTNGRNQCMNEIFNVDKILAQSEESARMAYRRAMGKFYNDPGFIEEFIKHIKKISGYDMDRTRVAVDELFIGWNEFKVKGLQQLYSLEEIIGKSEFKRRMWLLSRHKAFTTAQMEEAMKQGARLAMFEANKRARMFAENEVLSGVFDKMNGNLTEGKISYEKEVGLLRDGTKNRWGMIRDTAARMQGEPLATDAMKNFWRYVESEAKNIDKSKESLIKVKIRSEQDILKGVADSFCELFYGSSGGGGNKGGIPHSSATVKALTSAVESILADLGTIFQEIVEELDKTGEIRKNYKPRIQKIFTYALKGIGFIFEGIVLGFIIDTIMEQVADFWVKTLAKMVKNHKALEEILAYEVIAGVNVERIGYNVFTGTSFFDDNIIYTLSLLLVRSLGLLIGKSSGNNGTLGDIVRDTLRNNPQSLVACVKNDERKSSAMAVNAINNKAVVLYDVGNAHKSSTCINYVAYDFGLKALFIGFSDKKKSVYRYDGVPVSVVESFMTVPANSNSIGTWFNYSIRPVYQSYQRCTGNIYSAVGRGRIENYQIVSQVDSLIDKKTNIFLSSEVRQNQQTLYSLMRSYGACGFTVDADGRLHVYYKGGSF